MAWGEAQPGVFYCPGLSKNPVLIGKRTPAGVRARVRRCLCGAPRGRELAAFDDPTQKSRTRPRRMVGQAEVRAAGDHPRFLVADLLAEGFAGDADGRFTPARLQAGFSCARGERENVLTHQVLDREADRPGTHFRAGKQLRL